MKCAQPDLLCVQCLQEAQGSLSTTQIETIYNRFYVRAFLYAAGGFRPPGR